MVLIRRVAVAMAVLSCAAACATSGGIRVEGPVEPLEAPPVTTTAAGEQVSVDAIRVLRDDPAVAQTTKDALKSCVDGRYPVEVRYADLTGDGVPEILINAFSCTVKGSTQIEISSGLGAYVYTIRDGKPAAVFALQERGSYVQDDGEGVLLVFRVGYRPGDKACCPTDQELIHYRWSGTEFSRTSR